MHTRTHAALATATLTTTAIAGPFINGSFEDASIGVGSFTTLTNSTAIDGWVATNIDYIGTAWASSDGSRNIDLNSTGPGGVTQTFDTAAGTQYIVTFDLAGNPVSGPALKSVIVSAALDSAEYTFDITGRTTTDMGWTEETFVFTAVSDSTELSVRSGTIGSFGPALDNVRVEVVPAPAASAALAASALAIVRRRRRR